MDWDDLRFFLAIDRTKSLVGAAKELRVTQSTVGRRLAALESQLGVRLLHRTEQGYLPTRAGDAIREHVERVEAETIAVERAVGGVDTRLAGTVRIAGPELLASHVLAPCAAALYSRHPGITLELIANSTAPNLARREADVSIQLTRCEEGGMVVRRVGTMSFGLYASVSYLSRQGDPDPNVGCNGHFLATMVAERELPRPCGVADPRLPRAQRCCSGPTAGRCCSGPCCKREASHFYRVSVAITNRLCAVSRPFRQLQGLTCGRWCTRRCGTCLACARWSSAWRRRSATRPASAIRELRFARCDSAAE